MSDVRVTQFSHCDLLEKPLNDSLQKVLRSRRNETLTSGRINLTNNIAREAVFLNVDTLHDKTFVQVLEQKKRLIFGVPTP